MLSPLAPPRKMLLETAALALGMLIWAAVSVAQTVSLHPLSPEEQGFAQTLAQTRAVPLAHVTELLGLAKVNARVRTLIQPARAANPVPRRWSIYRQRFVGRVHVARGLAFWRQHRAVLNRASAQYGVPPSIIVAIIGVETLYGQHVGNFPVLDALYTLGFHHPEPARPERVQLFREQLADLIELDYTGLIDARRSKGSFAGALGLAQFLPGSLKRFARDGDGDARIDLFHSEADAIASVANFLREHGWQQDLPVFAPVTLPDAADALATHGLTATLSWQDLQARGAVATNHASGATPLWQQHMLGVVPLVDEVTQITEYRTATPNFYVLTQYNRSYFYAAAVADLAQALDAAQ